MRRAASIAVAAAVAAAVALVVAHSGAAPAAAPPSELVVRASFDRPLIAFGDAVTARVVVAFAGGTVRPNSVQVVADLAPFTLLSERRTSRTDGTLTITQRVACLTSACLARRIVLPRVRVSATTTDGTRTRAAASWPPLHLRSRVTAADLARAEPPLAADTTTGSPTYRIDPSTATTVLEIVAAFAAAAAAALVAFDVLRRTRREPARDELDRALALVREAETRPPPDRRRALALLARLLRSRDPAAQATARDLAWSRPAPEPAAVDELVTRIEQERAG